MKILKNKFIIIIPIFIILSCAGIKRISQTDKLGRIEKISIYYGSRLEHIEERKYSNKNIEPSKIIYIKNTHNGFETYREEAFIYEQNQIKEIIFYQYIKKRKTKSGVIKYNYSQNNIQVIEYNYYDTIKRKMELFGMDYYTYTHKELSTRRIILFEYNPITENSMQTSQYIITYKNGNSDSLQSWIMNKDSNMIIKNSNYDSKKINTIINTMRDQFIKKIRGE